jgi:L-lactate permease
MIGIVIILFIPALISLLMLTFFNNKSNARKVYLEFKKQISKDEQRWNMITRQIVLDKKFQLFEELTPFGVDVFLIKKENEEITVCPLTNNGQKKCMSLMSYENLLGELKENRLAYTYSIDTYSIYYQFDKPYEDSILWIFRRSNSVLKPRY